MPFCPNCRSEFQDWVRTCPDCHVPLVDIQPPPPADSAPDMYPVIWARAAGRFVTNFSVRIGKRALIAVVAIVVLALVLSGSFSYSLGEREGLAGGQKEAEALLTGFHGFLSMAAQDYTWMEFYEKQNAASANTGIAILFTSPSLYITTYLTRAQEQVPFAIVLPKTFVQTHLFTGEDQRAAPVFRGTLNPANKSKSEVYIYLGTGIVGIISILESNYPAVQSYSEFGSASDQTTIDGVQILKGKNSALAFKSRNIYFIIRSHDVADEELFEVAKSLISGSG
jgi:hypothetical protein